jgi:DNA-binding NarL/FixJ family response regulator
MDGREFLRRLRRAEADYARLRDDWQAAAARWKELSGQYARARGVGPAASAPPPPAASPTPPRTRSARCRSQLSRREIEVAALVAEGCTNRQIAARLVLTEGTVANHVRRICQRLGVVRRAQVAVWFVRRQATAAPQPRVPAA